MLVVVAVGVVVVFDFAGPSVDAAGAIEFDGCDAAGVAPLLLMLPVAGVVDVVGVVGNVVIGVGTGGKGVDIALAMKSVKPASDPP